MFIKRIVLFTLLSSWFFPGYADAPKTLEAKKISSALTVDGRLDESAWANADITGNFVVSEPEPGATPEFESRVRVLYSNEAVYVGATLEAAEGKILRELTLRDNFGNTDYFGLILSPYKDGVNGSSYIVTAAGVQIDSKYSSEGNDRSWDAVWESAVQMDESGWTVEMRIPFSAFRFPGDQEQSWNINFVRLVRETRELSYWSEVDPELEGTLNQSGLLTGIRDIESPPRLSATPFIVGTSNNSYDPEYGERLWDSDFSGGIDVRYGLSDAFTLDMTLIPDFSQARSDDEVLNLSPFEVEFSEQREFFNEGLDLLQKGGIFYSRRVGGRPIGYDAVSEDLPAGQTLVENPDKSRLYNAIKISGRNRSGLGMGFFNGITGKTYATIRDDEGETTKVLTDPVTNYNMIVLDQALKNNSSITFLNTNVLREGHFVDANVTGGLFNLKTTDLKYGVSGSGILTQRYLPGTTDLGHRWNLKFQKLSGKLIASLGYWEESHDYNINDLGFVLSPNDRNYSASIGYRIFEPFGMWRRANTTLDIRYSRLYKPNEYRSFTLGLRQFLLGRNNLGVGFSLNAAPVEGRDYFEPRTPDFSRYYSVPEYVEAGAFFSTNYNRRFALDGGFDYLWTSRDEEYRYNYRIEPRFRVNDRFTFSWNFTWYKYFSNVGFISPDPDSEGYGLVDEKDIIFGSRDRIDLENRLSFNYIFTKDMGLTFRARHYWSRVRYRDFYLLGPKGELLTTAYRGRGQNGQKLHDDNFNAFNIDLIYTWRFAPGSDLIFVWKNAILETGTDAHLDFFDNIDFLTSSPRVNSFSLKVVYYLDYLYFR